MHTKWTNGSETSGHIIQMDSLDWSLLFPWDRECVFLFLMVCIQFLWLCYPGPPGLQRCLLVSVSGNADLQLCCWRHWLGLMFFFSQQQTFLSQLTNKQTNQMQSVRLVWSPVSKRKKKLFHFAMVLIWRTLSLYLFFKFIWKAWNFWYL